MDQIDTALRGGAEPEDRPLKPAMLRGWRRRCPQCGGGSLFSGYLKVRDRCPACSEDFTPQRADDGPAYLTILIVGHLLAPVLHTLYVRFHLEPMVLASVMMVLCVGLSLYLLPRIKGAFISLQWAKRMYGFGEAAR